MRWAARVRATYRDRTPPAVADTTLAETPPDHRGEIQLTDALRRLRERRPLYAVRFTGRRYDTLLPATTGFGR